MKLSALLIVVVITIAVSAIAGPAFADITLAEYDVFSAPGDWSADMFYPNYIIAQTFVASATGTVSSIQVAVSKLTTTDVPMTWTIRSTYQSAYNGLQPDFTAGGALSTGTLANADCPGYRSWATVQMSAAELQAGQHYALVGTAFGSDSVYMWYGKSGAPDYPGRHLAGYYSDPQEALGSSSDDVGFRVIAVPEPSSVMALLGGIVGLGGLVRRRRA